jgi:hypothetical protein
MTIAADYLVHHHDLGQPAIRRGETIARAVAAFAEPVDLTPTVLDPETMFRWLDRERARLAGPLPPPRPLIMHPTEYAMWVEAGKPGGPVVESECIPLDDPGPVRLVVSR